TRRRADGEGLLSGRLRCADKDGVAFGAQHRLIADLDRQFQSRSVLSLMRYFKHEKARIKRRRRARKKCAEGGKLMSFDIDLHCVETVKSRCGRHGMKRSRPYGRSALRIDAA